MLSSSVCTDPELPPPSASIPEPGCAADEVMLVFPLLLLSSSVLLPAPDDKRALRWPKLLEYRVIKAGFGELETDVATAFSYGDDEVLGDGGDCGPNGERFLASASALRFEALPIEVRGEAGCD